MVVCTSTASGKSLCYVVPILEALAADPGATALLMFPTKALAQDQLRALKEYLAAAFGERAPCVEIYDGDTPMVRAPPSLKPLNPDAQTPERLPPPLLRAPTEYIPCSLPARCPQKA